MRAWVMEAPGDPAGLSLRDVARPTPGPGEALVRVSHAAVNFADGLMIRGRYQVRPPAPFTPGFEVSGVVVAAPAGSGLEPGQAVCGQVPWGGYADYVTAAAERWIVVPDGLGMAEAAALPVSFVTAHVALFDRARLQPDDSLLVLAAGGALGLATLQLARGHASPVIGLVGQDDKRAVALANGATHVFNYRTDDWVAEVAGLTGGRGVSVVLDPVGGDQTLKALGTLAWRGRLLLVGFASGAPAALPANRLLVRAQSAHGVFWSETEDGALLSGVRRTLADMASRGEICPLVSRTFAFEDAREAIALIETGATVGKLVIEVGDLPAGP